MTSESSNHKMKFQLKPVERGELSVLEEDKAILIPYRPFASAEKWIQYRFSAWSSWKAWFAMTCVVLFFGFGGPGFIVKVITEGITGHLVLAGGSGAAGAAAAGGQIVVEFFVAIVTMMTAVVSGIYLSKPTHLSLSRKAIALQWRRSGRIFELKMPWQNIGRIDLIWPPGKTSPQDCLVKFQSKYDHASALQIKLSAIVKEDDRERLLKSIETFAEDVQRSPQLIEMLTPAQDHSYTELWLQALSAPPKRERLTPLPPHAMLQERKYEVLDQLGVGGQGTAYLAREVNTSHEVVLKEFILPVYVDVNVRRQALERMQNEATMLRRLDNGRIVRLMDFFIEDHRGYLVLEKIDGNSLLAVVTRDGALSESEVISLALQMCEMLEYLHFLSPPVIHRDFTPDNLILGKDGTLKLVDFNVAQQTEATATGTVVGKHAYISPEQFRGRPTTQSDIYSLGATLYYLLTGEAPEPITASHPRQQRTDVSETLDAIVAKATAFAANKRYADALKLREDLMKAAPDLAIAQQKK
jgi:tRNA A-37 threonylcarbamoyl transferase component Bud32